MEYMLNQLVNVETGEVTDVSKKMKELELENQRLKDILNVQDELTEDMKFGHKLASNPMEWNKYFNN
jgi:cell shape-determining protein MreC